MPAVSARGRPRRPSGVGELERRSQTRETRTLGTGLDARSRFHWSRQVLCDIVYRVLAGLAETKKRIRDLGLRVTAPRLAVLRIIAEAERPLSHSEVVTRLGDDAVWDRATVYRNLIALVGVRLLRISSHAG